MERDESEIKAIQMDLRKQIEKLNREYYQDNKSNKSDLEYDKLLRKLEALEKQFPQFTSPNSPTQKVGSTISEMFTSLAHPFPMISLGNAMNESEFDAFISQVKRLLKGSPFSDSNLLFSMTPKMDGLALQLIYENGKLAVATTRGDGIAGEIVTDNALMVSGIKNQLDAELTERATNSNIIIVRGEVVMTKKVLDSFNKQLREKNEKIIENPRNIASGAMRQKDPQITKEKKIILLFLLTRHWQQTIKSVQEI